MISTITSKGQLTLPKEIRRILNLHSGNKVEFILDADGNVKMVPIKASIKEIKGIVPKPKKTVGLDDMQDAIEKRASSS
ncbi:MAG: AbrB/MazE/SpoVT family DNA-binding domain-containing protein [Calditrichaceae bacterium]|jgi:AbrB family looped-hinge helix DNA binding protein